MEGMFDLKELLELFIKEWKRALGCAGGGGALCLVAGAMRQAAGEGFSANWLSPLLIYALLGCLAGFVLALFLAVCQFFFGKKAWSIAWFEDKYNVDCMQAGQDRAYRAFCYAARRGGQGGAALLLSTTGDAAFLDEFCAGAAQSGYSVERVDLLNGPKREAVQPGRMAALVESWQNGRDWLVIHCATPARDPLAAEVAACCDAVLFSEQIGLSPKGELDDSLRQLTRVCPKGAICLVWNQREGAE